MPVPVWGRVFFGGCLRGTAGRYLANFSGFLVVHLPGSAFIFGGFPPFSIAFKLRERLSGLVGLSAGGCWRLTTVNLGPARLPSGGVNVWAWFMVHGSLARVR